MTKQILIVGPAWVGDMVMAQTLFMLLKAQQNCQIDVIAPLWAKSLLQRMPEVRQEFSLSINHNELKLINRYQIGKLLRAQLYDQAIVLPNSIKSALVPFWAKIPIRTGWLGEYRYGLLNDIRLLDEKLYPLMIQRFMALALPKQQKLENYQPIKPKLITDSHEVYNTVHKFNLAITGKKILALCPGAEFGPAKRWPETHFANIAKEKLDQGWQVWIFGSAKEEKIAHNINQATNQQCMNLTGKTNLAEVIDLLSIANVVLSNDSGLMHIAAALDRNLVVVYGSSSPQFTPPLNEKRKILKLDLACSPCFARECKFGHRNCLMLLTPKQVSTAIDELVQS